MKRNQSVLARKGILLLALLAMLALVTAAGPQPAEAWDCDWLPCPFDMHWDPWLCACVCDCPDVTGTCGPCW